MANLPKVVKITVELDTPGLRETLEQIIAFAFQEGFASAERQADQEPRNRMIAGQAYEDWRGWGPGLTLPGGQEFRYSAAYARNIRRSLESELLTREQAEAQLVARKAADPRNAEMRQIMEGP